MPKAKEPLNGARIKELRKALDLPQVQVAKRSGGVIDRLIVLAVEKGINKATSNRTRKALADGLGLSVNELVEYSNGNMLLSEAEARARKGLAKKPLDTDGLPAELVNALEFARTSGDYPDETLESAVQTGRKGRKLTQDEWLTWLREQRDGPGDQAQRHRSGT